MEYSVYLNFYYNTAVKMYRYILSILLFFLSAFTLDAQSVAVSEQKGNVSKEELLLKTYSPDPTASAIVLWEDCEVSFDIDRLSGEITSRKRFVQRIKILKESGRRYVNGKILLQQDYDLRETIKDFQIVTYNLVDCSIVESIANNDDIFKSRPDHDSRLITYFAPDVKVGSVVEISYILSSNVPAGSAIFTLQRDIPVNLSTYHVTVPSDLRFRRTILGSLSGTYDDTSLDPNYRSNKYRVCDLPSFKDEPMVYCPDQYLGSLFYEFADDGGLMNVCSDWTVTAQAVALSPISKQLYAHSPLRKEARMLADAYSDSISRLAALVTLVRSLLPWDHETGLEPLNFFLMNVSGSADDGIDRPAAYNSADLNSLLGSVATEAGFTVTPVLLRLRTDGDLSEEAPGLGAFSTFILHIKSDDGLDVLVDAANPAGFFNVLPDNYLVDKAFEVMPDGSWNWIDIAATASVSNIASYSTVASLSPDGIMAGVMSAMYFNESAFAFKDHFMNLGKEKSLMEGMNELVDASLSDVTMSSLYDQSGTTGFKLSFSKNCVCSGDEIKVNPFLVCLLSDAGFRPWSRTMPVDFAYPESISYVFRIDIPEGYEVSLPEPCSASALPAMMDFKALSDGKVISVYFKFDNRAYRMDPSAYSEVRDLWIRASSIQNCNIVFRKVDKE